MCSKSIIFFFLLCVASTLAQLSPFFGGFPLHFSSPFGNFGSAGGSSFPGEGGGRSNTGPILFPPAPESRDTSGVIVGASGYGFVPPGGKGVAPARGSRGQGGNQGLSATTVLRYRRQSTRGYQAGFGQSLHPPEPALPRTATGSLSPRALRQDPAYKTFWGEPLHVPKPSKDGSLESEK